MKINTKISLAISALAGASLVVGIFLPIAISSQDNNVGTTAINNFESNVAVDQVFDEYFTVSDSIDSAFYNKNISETKVLVNSAQAVIIKSVMSDVKKGIDEGNNIDAEFFYKIFKSKGTNVSLEEVSAKFNESLSEEQYLQYKQQADSQNMMDYAASNKSLSTSSSTTDLSLKIHTLYLEMGTWLSLSWIAVAGFWSMAWFWGISIPAAVATTTYALAVTVLYLEIQKNQSNIINILNNHSLGAVASIDVLYGVLAKLDYWTSIIDKIIVVSKVAAVFNGFIWGAIAGLYAFEASVNIVRNIFWNYLNGK